ncbi:MAG: type II toxin-antitoxin system RelE/ParE family toxin [Bacteroidales bacterium]|nr:type II toxin-antitoxin system RelE/ParE family toxin [Bacteroidales bacterium]
MTQVREKVQFLQRNPKAHNIRYENVRTAVLNVFPFMIHYSIDEKNQIVVVLAVLHTSRNPDIWGKIKKY